MSNQAAKDWAIYREKLSRAEAAGDKTKAKLLERLLDLVEKDLGVTEKDAKRKRRAAARAIAKARRTRAD